MKRRKWLAFLMILVVLFSTLEMASQIALAAPRLNKTKVTLTLNSEVVLFVKNTEKTAKWSTSDKKVATVNKYGEVRAIDAGEVTITARIGKKKYTCDVTVPKQGLEQSKIMLKSGGQTTLQLKGVDSSDEILWGTDNEELIEVSQQGVVMAKSGAIGTTRVFVTVNNGICNCYECEVTVYAVDYDGQIIVTTPEPTADTTPTATPKPTPVPVKNITLSETGITVRENETKTLSVIFNPVNASNQKVKWNSTDTSVATVSQKGEVKGIKSGKAVVSAVSEDGSYVAMCTVNVSGRLVLPSDIVAVKNITLSEKNMIIRQGESKTLTVKFNPSNATNQKVVWVSTDYNVVNVSNQGVVTGKKDGGSAVVYATSQDGSHIGICVVKVQGTMTTPTPSTTPSGPATDVTGINPTTQSETMRLGDTKDITVSVTPSNATNKEIHVMTLGNAVSITPNTGTVTSGSKITLKAENVGTAYIILSTKSGGYIGVITATVQN